MKRIKMLACVGIALLVLAVNSFAAEKIFTLPVSGENLQIAHGWYYDAGDAHYAVDYQLNLNDPIYAPADGVAMSTYSSLDQGYGFYAQMVIIRYNQTTADERHYASVSAHLNSYNPNILYRPKDHRVDTDYENWTPVRRGEIIGYAGESGTSWVHLHQEHYIGDYADKNSSRFDPYDIYGMGEDYLPDKGCGQNSMMVECLVGSYSDGWNANDATKPLSSSFLSSYLANDGYPTFGLPWDNGRSQFVHCWPDNCSAPGALYVQDFLPNGLWFQLVYNPDKNLVYPTLNRILEYWNSHSGYSLFGPPLGTEIHDDFYGATWAVQVFKPIGAEIATQARYIAYGLYTGNYQTGYLWELPADVRHNLEATFNSVKMTTDGNGHGFGGGGGDDDDDDIPIPGVLCVDVLDIPAADWASYYSGMIFNGRSDVCGGFAWQLFWVIGSASMGTSCNQGENSHGDNNCAFGIANNNYVGNHYNTQLTNLDYPLDIIAGKTYLFSAMARNGNYVAYPTRTITVALTPRATYDNYDYIGSLTDVLASPVDFTIDRAWRRVSYHFTATRTDHNGAIRIFYGDTVGSMLLDDIYLAEFTPETNLIPALNFHVLDQGEAVVDVLPGDASELPGLFGPSISAAQAVTISVFVNDYGVYDTQRFDPYGNTLNLPANYSQCNFYITDSQGTQRWFNIWLWTVTNAQIQGSWLDYSALLAGGSSTTTTTLAPTTTTSTTTSATTSTTTTTTTVAPTTTTSASTTTTTTSTVVPTTTSATLVPTTTTTVAQTTTTVTTTTGATTTTTIPSPGRGLLTDNAATGQLEILWPIDAVAQTISGFLVNGMITEIPLSQLADSFVCLEKKGGSYNQVCEPFNQAGLVITFPNPTADFWLFIDDGPSGQYWLWIDKTGSAPSLPWFDTNGIQASANASDAWLHRGSQ
ncbi:MAG: M23 family metallopeptidase [Candidatus Kerfeldbacteria bacterium]|nr:M23 family metallopeptidase [Candidatus Kerfeldbacteria bacterium]